MNKHHTLKMCKGDFMDNSFPNNKRYFYIDVLKVVAIFMVLSLHIGMWNYDFISSPHVTTYVQYLLRINMEGVYLFVLINGFLLFGKAFSLKKHLKKTLKIFGILVIWGDISSYNSAD